jgi:hypothetical protein
MSVFLGDKCGVCGREISIAGAHEDKCSTCGARLSDLYRPLAPVGYGGKVIGYHDTSRPWPTIEECREFTKDVDPEDCQGMFY